MRSKKRSAAKSPPQPDAPKYFADASLGHDLVNRLRAAGMVVIAHDDSFPQGTEDPIWLSRAGQEQWVVLTKDQAIRYSPAELAALKAVGVRQFVLASGNLTSEQMAKAFISARPAMERLLRITSGAFVARVTKDGRISRTHDLSS